MSESRIVIGDIHGCAKTFEALLNKLPKDIPITVSGDYVDRGPRSNEVIQLMIDRKIDGTLGNHEQMIIDFFNENPSMLKKSTTLDMSDDDLFLANGGIITLESYGYIFNKYAWGRFSVETPDDLTQIKTHLEWVKNLPVYIEYPDCVNKDGRKLIVSHSSIGKFYKEKDDPTNKQLIIWNRFVVHGGIQDVSEIFNVIGHTVLKPEKVCKHFAAIDTGACFKGEKGYGELTSLQYPEMVVVKQENID